MLYVAKQRRHNKGVSDSCWITLDKLEYERFSVVFLKPLIENLARRKC